MRLRGLKGLARAQPQARPVGLIIDEFQSIIERGGATAEAQIRSVIQEHSRVGYVFAGSHTHLMTDMTTAVQTVLETTVCSLDPLFTQIWTKLTAVQQKTLLAVIREHGTGLSTSSVVRTIGASPSTVQSALRSLNEQSILRDDPSKGQVRLCFEDPFFAQWIKLNVMNG